MLNQTPLPTTSQIILGAGADQRQLITLIRFVAVLAVVLGLASVYVWQVGVVTEMRNDTLGIEAETAAVERANTALIIQLIQWKSPSYIESKAKELGMKPAAPPVYIKLPTSDAAGHRQTADANARAWWRFMTGQHAWPIAVAQTDSQR
jgi:hypothetical protein